MPRTKPQNPRDGEVRLALLTPKTNFSSLRESALPAQLKTLPCRDPVHANSARLRTPPNPQSMRRKQPGLALNFH